MRLANTCCYYSAARSEPPLALWQPCLISTNSQCKSILTHPGNPGNPRNAPLPIRRQLDSSHFATMSLWDDPRAGRFLPIWNPVTQCLNYPWFDGDNIDWLPAHLWLHRHNNRELFGRSRYIKTPTPEQQDDDDVVHGTDGAEAADEEDVDMAG
eukprot:8703588-Pyramimonas_sp.AAC.1